MTDASIPGSILPPQIERPDPQPGEAPGIGEQRRHTCRAGAFAHELLFFDQGHDRGFDRRFGNGDDLAHDIPDDRQRQRTHALDRDALGDRRPADPVGQPIARRDDAGIERGLDRHDLGA